MKLKKWFFWIIVCLGLMTSVAQAATQEEQLELAKIYNNQVIQYYQQGQFQKALPLAEEAFKIRVEILGHQHPNTLTSLNNLAAIYHVLGRLSEALPLFENGYHLTKKMLGEKHPDTLDILNNLAIVYRELGRLSEALPLLENCYRSSSEVLGEKHPNTLMSLDNLASTYQLLGRLSEALPLSKNAYRLYKEVLGEKHRDTLISLSNLTSIYQDLGLFSEALPLFEKEYRLRREVLGEKHPDTLVIFNNLALAYQDLGRLSEALPMFEKSYLLGQEVLGEKHPHTLTSINNLAVMYKDLGRLKEAFPWFEKGYYLRQEVLGEKHPHTLQSLNNLAFIHHQLGHLSKALPLYEKSYRQRSEVLGEKHYDTLESLNNFALIYKDLGHLSEALPLFEKGYHLSLEVLGEKHPRHLGALVNLASIYNDLGRSSEAFSLSKKGYHLFKEVLGEKHPLTLTSLRGLAYAYLKQGNINQTIKHLEKFVEGVEQLRSGDLSAENRQALFKKRVSIYFVLSGMYIRQSRFIDAFRLAEMSKSRTLLESSATKLAAWQSGLTPTEQQQLQNFEARLAFLNNRIAKVLEKNRLDDKIRLSSEKNQLVSQLAQFKRELKAKYPKYAQLSEVQIIGAKEGAKLIQSDTLLISYLLSDYNHVLVFTLDVTGNLQVHDLGEIARLEQTLETYRELLAAKYSVIQLRSICYYAKVECKTVWQIADGSFVIGNKPSRDKKPKKVKSLDEISRDLAQKFLAPLKERLGNYRRWIISPDGALALIPFETLILDEQPVIAKHEISYVQSLSILALLKQREQDYQSLKGRKTLLAMGAPRYHSSEQPPKNCDRAIRAPNIDLETLNPQDYQSALKELNDKWCNLLGAKKELAAMKKLFTDSTIYQGAEASEAKLQSLNKIKALTRYKYLVFSTHGYLSPQTPALSALVLDLLDTTDKADGYVTAGEWPGYDLKSDLMVLSACQTGVGKVMRGEGVMGLPYAFYVAGNKNTLMTLWNVVDDSTAEFISRFFKKLKNGKGQIEALTETKREFLQIEKYRLPAYWAAFVLYGI